MGGDPSSGASDVFVALGMSLAAAMDNQSAGNETYIQFSQWIIEDIEVWSETENLELEVFFCDQSCQSKNKC